MINKAGLNLIKEFEGFRAETYRCSAGVLTIGYGTTAAADVGIDPKPGMRISQVDAEEYLKRTLDKFGAQIRPLLKREPNENQWAAMLSLAYNIGPGAFGRSSVLKRFNAGDDAGAADAFGMWIKADGKVLKGLVRRREAEKALFLTPPTKMQKVQIPPAPSGWAALLAAVLSLFKKG